MPGPERRRLFMCRQKPAERLETAKALMALLEPTSDTYGGPDAVDAFLCGGGPSIMKYRLDSMDGMRCRCVSRCCSSRFILSVAESLLRWHSSAVPCAGDWMGEARLGVTDMIDKIARLPGLQKTFDKVAFIKEKHVLTARRELHEMAHSHGPDGIKSRALTPQAFCELLRVSRVAAAHLRVFCLAHARKLKHTRDSTRTRAHTGECETTGSSRECGREDCNIVQRRVERAFTARAVENRPGDAPQGTVHVVELHQQLKSLIEK